MRKGQVKFIAAVALQVGIILAIALFKLIVLAGGTDVFLRIEPIDPRDLLRGDYVAFTYEISSLDRWLAGGEVIRNGDTVYVVLAQRGKYWTAVRITKTPPTDGSLFIKGRVESGGEERRGDPFSYEYDVDEVRLHIVYGIEQYFIPEGRGSTLPFSPEGALAARVRIDEHGNAVLRALSVNDKPWP